MYQKYAEFTKKEVLKPLKYVDIGMGLFDYVLLQKM